MTQLTARFKQDPSEVRRYILDYTLDLNEGELVESVTVTVTSPTGDNPANFSVTNITIASGSIQAFFYASLGTNGQSYECKFLATTSLEQELVDVVQFDIQSKV